MAARAQSSALYTIWHQCFKYKTPEGETKRIFANTKPFTTTEAFYADSKFYLEPTKLRSCESLLLHLQIKWLSRKNEIRILKKKQVAGQP